MSPYLLGEHMKKLTEEKAKQIFEQQTLPENSKVGLPAFAFYTELDATKQPLRKIRDFNLMVLSLPPGLGSEAREVMIRLFRCFHKAGEVSEGLIGDLMFGFGIPTLEERPLSPEESWRGLCQLKALGYVKFQAKDGAFIDEHGSGIGGAWVRYQPKLLEAVYERGSSSG